MTGADEAAEDIAAQNEVLRGAVIVALQTSQSPRVIHEAVRFAHLLDVPLVVVHVDATRFVTYEAPDGFVHTAPIDISVDVGEAQFTEVQAAVDPVLSASGLTWTARQLVGDPAVAIAQLASTLDASLIVVGTRRPGLGESIRQFFTGSVAARLSHRQPRPLLVVPHEDLLEDGQDYWPE